MLSKNIIIIGLAIMITILIGIIIITNYALFSQEWLIGFGMIAVSIAVSGFLIYLKIRR